MRLPDTVDFAYAKYLIEIVKQRQQQYINDGRLIPVTEPVYSKELLLEDIR